MSETAFYPWLRPKYLILGLLLATSPLIVLAIYLSNQGPEVQFLNGGIPISKAELTFIDDDGVECAISTDLEGKARFPNPPRSGWMIVQPGEGFKRGGTLAIRPKGSLKVDFHEDRTIFTSQTWFGTTVWTQRNTTVEAAGENAETEANFTDDKW